jgi:hypothetical protein
MIFRMPTGPHQAMPVGDLPYGRLNVTTGTS